MIQLQEVAAPYQQELEYLRPLLEEALDRIDARPEGRRPSAQKLKDYATGNQIGERGFYWRGRRPKDGSFDEIAKLAVEADVIGPALRRQRGGIIGKDFEWSAILPAAITDEEGKPQNLSADDDRATPELKEVQAALTSWHRDAGLHGIAKDAEYAKSWGGYSTLRVYVPDVYKDMMREGFFAGQPLESALEIIHIHALDRTQAGPVEDEHGRRVGHFYRYAAQDENKQEVEFVELHGPRWIYVLRRDALEWELDGEPVENPLFDPTRLRRPRMLMYTLERDEGSCLTTSVLDKQDSVIEEWIYMKRGSSQYGGYRSVIVGNAKEVRRIDDATGEPSSPIPWTMAPDVVIELEGLDIYNDVGETIGKATPTVTVIEPVDPDTFLKKIDKFELSILEDFDQTWQREGHKAVSGESKRESRESWEKRIALEAPPLVDALEWALRTAKDLVAWLCGQTERYKEITFSVRLFLDVTPGNLKLAVALIPAYEKNLMSREAWTEINPAIPPGQIEAELARLRERDEAKTAERQVNDQRITEILNRTR